MFSATCVGVPWQLRPDQRNLVRPVVPEAEAEQGVAPVIGQKREEGGCVSLGTEVRSDCYSQNDMLPLCFGPFSKHPLAHA